MVSMWNRPPVDTSIFLLPRDHSMCLASPEKAQATVRTLPGSMLMSSGKASILGAEPIALIEDPSMWDVISVRLLELMAYVSDVTEDMLDIDMVSNFISAAMLLKELDSIMDDIIVWWEDEEKAEDSSILCISFFVIIDEAFDDASW